MAALEARFLLGLCLSLSSCLLSSVGFTLQRKAQLLLEEERGRGGKRSFRLLWGVGVALYILAAAPDVRSYMLVPQVVCTTVACFRLVVISVMAHAFLGERLGSREVLGMLACSAGTFLSLVFGPRCDQAAAVAEGEPEESLHVKVWIYLGIGLALLCCLLVTEHDRNIERYKSRERLHFVVLPSATALAFALEKVCNTALGFVPMPTSLANLLGSPLLLGMLAAMGVLGLTDFYLNLRGAARMPVQVFISTEFALETSIKFFQSMAILDEYSKMAPLNIWLSASGSLISLAGALFIQPPKLSHEPSRGKASGQLVDEHAGTAEQGIEISLKV